MNMSNDEKDEAVKTLAEKSRVVSDKILEVVKDENAAVVLFSTVSVLAFFVCMGSKDMNKRKELIDTITMQLKEMAKLDDIILGGKGSAGKGH